MAKRRSSKRDALNPVKGLMGFELGVLGIGTIGTIGGAVIGSVRR